MGTRISREELAMAVAGVVEEQHEHDPIWVLDDLFRNEAGRTILHLWHLECLACYRVFKVAAFPTAALR